jgi:hypothetical protein
MSLGMQLVVLVLGVLALSVAILAFFPRGFPGSSEDNRPAEMLNPAVAVAADAAVLSQGAQALVGQGLQSHFGVDDSWINPLRGFVSVTELRLSDFEDGVAIATAKADVNLTGWLPITLNIDRLQVALVPVVIDDLQGNFRLNMAPVVTDLQIRELGQSPVGLRLNQLAAHFMTSTVKPVEQKVKGLQLKVDVKKGARAVHFGFGSLTVAAEEDTLLIGAGPVVPK